LKDDLQSGFVDLSCLSRPYRATMSAGSGF
jgi:hypothetical protein